MKKINLFIVFFLFTLVSFSQNNLGKADDAARIVLSTYIPSQVEGLTDAAKANLANKLSQISTRAGMGGSYSSSRFIITANVLVLTKDITPTAPPMHAYTLELTLYIGDGIAGTKFSSISFTLNGVGESETKAYISALKNMKIDDPKYQSFIDSGKTKIIEYYNSKCDFILKDAEMLSSKNEYDKAIETLTSIPNVCKNCYDKAMSAVGPIYIKYIDRQCKINLQEAKNVWNQSQDASGASSAANYLGQIDPNASCYSEALALSNTIGKRIRELDQREWNFQMKQQQDNVDLQKATIKAARDIGVAYGNGPKANLVQYNVYGWW